MQVRDAYVLYTGGNPIAYLTVKQESMADIRKLTVEFAKKGSPQLEEFVK